MHRLSSWLLGALALAVFAAAGYVVLRQDPVPHAGEILPVVGVPTSSSPTSAAATGRRVVAFLGDDWTAGVGASSPATRFTSLLADRLDATERNFGADGTGYARSQGGAGGYGTRVAALVAARPDVVVVSGGRNDTIDYLPTLRSAATALFAALRDKLPGATLIAVAPLWGDSPAPGDLAPVAAAVQQAVTAVGGTYVELADPIRGHPEDMSDAADPNDKGYAAIAAALTPKLRALLP